MPNCQNCKKDFEIDSDDQNFYKKVGVPHPTFCYLCRAQRRMAFRDDRPLHKRKSDLSKKTIFSTFPESVPFPVYTLKEWLSDDWDAKDYAQDYDWNRPFFEQFLELSNKTPKPAKSAFLLENSDYCNNASETKNCYLLFNTSYSEDCAYGNGIVRYKTSFDNSHIEDCELAYETINSAESSRVFFSEYAVQSTDIYFSKNVWGCTNCFGCTNLRKKHYYIFNKPYEKKEYEEKIQELLNGSHKNIQEIKEKTEKLHLQFPNKYRSDGTKSVNVSGEYIYNSKNVKDSYWNVGGEDLRYCQYLAFGPQKDSYDVTIYGDNLTLCYEGIVLGGQTYNCKFCIQTYINCQNLEYAEYCKSSSDCFGCVSLRNDQYCILNKQYSKEEYKELVQKIKRHMDKMPFKDKGGEFISMENSFQQNSLYLDITKP